MKKRIRDIEDSFGCCLRITLAQGVQGPLVTLERLDRPHRAGVTFGLYGTEILAGFILSARLSMPGPMPEEEADDGMAVRFTLLCGEAAHIRVEDIRTGDDLLIGAPLWDRLYAELGIVTAHAREMERRCSVEWH